MLYIFKSFRVLHTSSADQNMHFQKKIVLNLMLNLAKKISLERRTLNCLVDSDFKYLFKYLFKILTTNIFI